MLNLTKAERSQLATAADNAVSDALDGTVTGWRSKAPTNEPDAVAAVVSVGMPATAPGWTSVLSPLGYTVQFIGVFCHQTPKVDFLDAAGAAQNCELADLLIVVDNDGKPANVTDRRALLVQAKMAHRPALALNGRDRIQFDLLSRWPQFKFSAHHYPKNWRDIGGPGTPPGLFDSASYGAIDLLPSTVAWQQLDVSNLSMGSGRSFGETLAAMAAGLEGRDATPGGSDDWSSTVEELLSTTYKAIAGGYPGTPWRGVTTIAFAVPGTSIGLAILPPGGQPPGLRGERQDGPISVIHIRIRTLPDEP